MRLYTANTVLFLGLLLSISIHTFKKFGMPLAYVFPDADLWMLFKNNSVCVILILCAACLIVDWSNKTFLIVTAAIAVRLISYTLVYNSGGVEKLISINFAGMDRSLFEISIPLSYLIASVYYARRTYKITPVIPLSCVAAAVNDLGDEVFGDPYNFNEWEKLFMVTAIVLILLYAINKHYRFVKL